MNAVASAAPLADTLGRPLHDLRVSVIETCNYRCPYCMPEDDYPRDHQFLGKAERLRFEEIERIARAGVMVDCVSDVCAFMEMNRSFPDVTCEPPLGAPARTRTTVWAGCRTQNSRRSRTSGRGA